MMNSILFMLSFLFLLVGLLLYPRSQKKLGFVQEAVMNFLVVMCYGAVGAGLISNLKLPVNLISMSLLYLILAIVIWSIIICKKNVQKLTISKIEVISILILSIIFLLIELKVFSLELRAAYDYNTDAGNHLVEALQVVRRQKVSGIYFAALYNGLTIELLQPFLEEIQYYKGFVLADNFHYYFELLFYYAVVFSLAKKKHTKYAAPVITLLLWCGYPLYSYIEGHYVYWGWGAVLLCFVLYEMEQYVEKEETIFNCVIRVLAGFIGILLCYTLFAPFAVVAILLVVVGEFRRRKIKLNKKIWLCVAGFGALCGAAAVYIYYSYFVARGISIFEGLKVKGGCYVNLYTDFIWTLPVLLVFCYSCIKKETRPHIYGKIYVAFIGIQTILLVMFYAGQLSAYYFYKFYYPLWILNWLVVALAIDTLKVEKGEYKYIWSYAVIVAIAYISCFGKLPELMNGTEAGWISEEANVGTNLYSRNMSTLSKDFEARKYSNAQFEICEYVMNNIRDEGEKCLFAGWWDCRGQSNWYRAITNMGALTDKIMAAEGDTWKQILEADNVDYYVVLKTSDLYKDNTEYFDNQNRIFENEEGFVVQVH